MKRRFLNIQAFMKDEVGVTSIEYAKISSLIAVVIILAVATLGTEVLRQYLTGLHLQTVLK